MHIHLISVYLCCDILSRDNVLTIQTQTCDVLYCSYIYEQAFIRLLSKYFTEKRSGNVGW